ncbi:MAG: hypothetical protein V1725_00110 [archaeon]
MKRLIALFLFCLLALSLALYGVAAENAQTGVSDDTAGNAADKTDTSALTASSETMDDNFVSVSSEAATTIDASTTLEDCKEKLKQYYPRVQADRLEKQCLLLNRNLRPAAMPVLYELKAKERNAWVAIESEIKQKFGEIVSNITPEEKKKLVLMNREQLSKFMEQKKALNSYRLQAIDNAETYYKARQVTAEKRKQHLQNYDYAKEQFKQLREAYAEKNAEFKDLLQSAKDCTENCTDVQNSSFAAAKDSLLKLADMMQSSIEQVKEKLLSSEDLSEASVDESTARIDALLQSVQDARAKIELASTKDELKAAGKDLISIWKEVGARLRLHEAKLFAAEINTVIIRAKFLEGRMNNIITYLKDKQIDTTPFESQIEEFSTHIEAARSNYDDAMTLLRQAWQGTDRADAVQKAHTLLKDARQELQEAHVNVQAVVAYARTSGVNLATVEAPQEILIEETNDVLAS